MDRFLLSAAIQMRRLLERCLLLEGSTYFDLRSVIDAALMRWPSLFETRWLLEEILQCDFDHFSISYNFMTTKQVVLLHRLENDNMLFMVSGYSLGTASPNSQLFASPYSRC